MCFGDDLTVGFIVRIIIDVNEIKRRGSDPLKFGGVPFCLVSCDPERKTVSLPL